MGINTLGRFSTIFSKWCKFWVFSLLSYTCTWSYFGKWIFSKRKDCSPRGKLFALVLASIDKRDLIMLDRDVDFRSVILCFPNEPTTVKAQRLTMISDRMHYAFESFSIVSKFLLLRYKENNRCIVLGPLLKHTLLPFVRMAS